jgi:hypothetical protein
MYYRFVRFIVTGPPTRSCGRPFGRDEAPARSATMERFQLACRMALLISGALLASFIYQYTNGWHQLNWIGLSLLGFLLLIVTMNLANLIRSCSFQTPELAKGWRFNRSRFTNRNSFKFSQRYVDDKGTATSSTHPCDPTGAI